jgi:hypothetical protein
VPACAIDLSATAFVCDVGVELKTQTTGLLGGRLPNKGGLVAKLEYRGTSLCFVCSHLAAHEGSQHCQERNDMAFKIQEGARVGDPLIGTTPNWWPH